MKQEIVTVVLAVLVMGLFLPGCAQGQVNELEAEIAEHQAEIVEQQAEIAELKSENERLGEENLKLQKEADKLEEQTTAKMEMTFEPDPVPPKEGEWRWRVILKEVKGFGVKLNDITMQIHHGEDGIIDSWSDKSWLGAMDYYLPAYGQADSERHIPCQESATHVIFVVTGVDDNGHSITAENRIDLLPKKPGSAKIEITFSANPVPCENGRWQWRIIFTEVNGIGVKVKNVKRCSYKNSRLLQTIIWDGANVLMWFSDAYLPAYGSVNKGAGFPCQNVTHNVYTVTGIDDNGNEVTAEGKVEFVK